MLVLGIESSCDETACAIVKEGQILSNIVASQADLHAPHGGVIPELAARRHVDLFPPLLKRALTHANISLSEIDLIAVTRGPGLIGALLIGLGIAKGLSLSLNRPFIGVNHIEAHLYAALMHQNVSFPSLGVVLSGGHTALLLIKAIGDYQLIGQTQDDAIGEAFDKVASLLDLPYPGGPQIEKLAKEGDPTRFPLKAGKVKERPYDFSFSGLKTGVLYLVKGQNADKNASSQITHEEKKDVAASFQHAAFSDIVNKSLLAAKQYRCHHIVIGGGVSQNKTLRRYFEMALPPHTLCWPREDLCLDNAAMIAGLGGHQYKQRREGDSFDLEALPRIPFPT